MSRADSLAVSDKAVQDFVLEGEVSEAEVNAGVAQGRKWFSLRRLRLGFSFSFTENGYIVFPVWLGGLIIQWGLTATLATETVAPLSFPIAFPTACLGGVVSGNRATPITGGCSSWYFSTPTLTGATLVHDTSNGGSMAGYWLAWGK